MPTNLKKVSGMPWSTEVFAEYIFINTRRDQVVYFREAVSIGE